MLDLWRRVPALRFFGEIFLMVLAAAVVIGIFGWIQKWSSATDYSDGFFFACVALAAISSSRAVFRRSLPTQQSEQAPTDKEKELESYSNLNRYFATRSFNFKMLMSAVVCLILSILITQ